MIDRQDILDFAKELGLAPEIVEKDYVINLFRRDDLRQHPALIGEVLAEKCMSKGVAIPTFATLETSPHRAELESEWSNMLAHQLPQLPPFEAFWAELPQLFEWLDGRVTVPELKSAPETEPTDMTWTPPATVWRWGMGVPVEAIRFAAANHLCVELGYKESVRLIEPYAFRRSSAGAFLLCAVKVESREARTYRLDRVQSVRVSNTPFRPAFRIEIGGTGVISAPRLTRPRTGVPTLSSTRSSVVRPTRSRASGYGPRLVHVVKCTVCGKEFKRSKADYSLRPHKGKGGWQCHSMTGYLVRTTYE